jgi:hypothetical protein
MVLSELPSYYQLEVLERDLLITLKVLRDQNVNMSNYEIVKYWLNLNGLAATNYSKSRHYNRLHRVQNYFLDMVKFNQKNSATVIQNICGAIDDKTGNANSLFLLKQAINKL